MISMELAVFGGIPLGVWIVILLWPFDHIAHGFHDGYALDGSLEPKMHDCYYIFVSI